MANLWHRLPQQLYLELAKLGKDGLIQGRAVVHCTPTRDTTTPTRADGPASAVLRSAITTQVVCDYPRDRS